MKTMDPEFDPTAADLDLLLGDVLEATFFGTWPLFMIDAIGVPYFGYLENGLEFEDCPWIGAIDRFLAYDQGRHVHWMHPSIKACLASLTVQDFRPEVTRENRIRGLTIRETAEVLEDHSLRTLSRLNARQRITDPLHARLQTLAPVGTPADAQDHLLDLFRTSGIGPDLGWSLAQVALRIPRDSFHTSDPWRCPLTRAGILARLTDPARVARPDPAQVREALIVARLIEDLNPETKRTEIDTLAAAMTHGLLRPDFSSDRIDPVTSLDLLSARIRRGDFDPHAEDVSRERPQDRVEQVIAGHLHETGEISAHAGLRLVRVANARLAALGYKTRVDFATCREEAHKITEIPF